MYSYDANLVLIIIFACFVLPAIYNSLILTYDFPSGRSAFLLLYPLMEYVMEATTHYALHSTMIGSFYQYQFHLFILGLRVGIMTSTSVNSFEFWYLGFIFLIKRVLESTNLVYIGVRRALYLLAPDNMKHKVSMQEIPEHRKGTEGFFFENLVWLAFYYFWWGTNTIVPSAVKGGTVVVVDDC